MSRLKHNGSINPELMRPELSNSRPYCDMPSSNIIYKKEFLIMKTNINKLIAIIALCSIGFIPASAFAAKDDIQYRTTLHIQQAQQKLEQAKAASGTERQALLTEHMKLMQKCMSDMSTMKPSANMTSEETEAWTKVCRKQMSDLLNQMKEDSKLQMTNCDMNMK